MQLSGIMVTFRKHHSVLNMMFKQNKQALFLFLMFGIDVRKVGNTVSGNCHQDKYVLTHFGFVF